MTPAQASVDDPVEGTNRQSTDAQVPGEDREAAAYRSLDGALGGGQPRVDGSDARFDPSSGYAAGDAVDEEVGPVAAEGEMDYWEEVTGEDGTVYFFNHTDQEYHTSLPACEENEDDTGTANRTYQEDSTPAPKCGDAPATVNHNTDQEYHASLPSCNDDTEMTATTHTDRDYNAHMPTCGDANPENHTNHDYRTSFPTHDDENATTKEAPTHSAGDHESRLTVAQTPETHEEGVMERWENQMWDGIDGEVFVPWKEEDPGDMKASPDEIGLSGNLPQEEESLFVPDDPATVREQNLRALLVLLPAKVMDGIVKAATERAMLHSRRTATADAQRQRRSLLLSRAQFRHTRRKRSSKEPKVLSPGLVFPVASGAKGGVQAKDDGTENEVESWSSEEDEAGAEQTQPEEDWRRNERDDLVGGKLQEVLRVLFSGSKEETRLTMREICLSSQGIGPAGALALAPALKTCVVVALYLGNNAIGDEGVASMADGLRHARGLQKLHLNNNEITDVGCHKLTNALGPLKVLSTLNLSHNPFGEKACLSLAILLSQHGCSLRSLSVAGCLDVDPSAWKTLNFRQGGVGGKTLDPPRPGDEGAVALAAALMSPYGCPLRGFHMTNAGLRTLGAKAIAAALCANETLETVDLSGNDFARKEDETAAGQSAAELLSLGLQVNTSVRTIVLRACGLSREQVLAIRKNASCSMTAGRKFCQGETGSPDARSGNGTSDASGRRLSWRTEKSLGFRAAKLREWLLDAARVKGMRYPRPPSPAEGGDASAAETITRGYENDKLPISRTQERKPCIEGFSGGAAALGVEANQPDTQTASLVGSQLWKGLADLQTLVESFDPGVHEPIAKHGNWSSSIGSSGGGRAHCSVSDTKTYVSHEGSNTKQSALQSGGVTRSLSSTGLVPPNTDKEVMQCETGLETEGTHAADAPTDGDSIVKSAPPKLGAEAVVTEVGDMATSTMNLPSPDGDDSAMSASLQESTTNLAGTEEPKSLAEGVSKSNGPLASDMALPPKISTVTTNPPAVSPPSPEETFVGSGRDRRSPWRAHSPPGEARHQGQENGKQTPLKTVRPGGGTHTGAAELEAGAQEGRRLTSIVWKECKGLDSEQAAFVRETRLLRESRTQLQRGVQKEASVLRARLVDAGVARDVAADGVRRLWPVTEAAIRTARARGAELNDYRTMSRGQEGGLRSAERSSCSSEELLESDWRERSEHAESMKKELREAQIRLEGDQRMIDELRALEQTLTSRSNSDDIAFREKFERMSSSMVNLRAKRRALLKTERAMKTMTIKLEELAGSAREEEALRETVPAGSGRRDLDLQVAEAMRVASEATRDTENTRWRYSEAAARLENGRGGLLMSPQCRVGGSGKGSRQPFSTLASSTRPWASPTFTTAPDRSHSTSDPLRPPNDKQAPHFLYKPPEMAGSGGNILADRAGVRRSGSPAGRTSDGRNAAEAGESWPEVYTQSREGGGEVKRKDGGLRKKGKDKEEETSLEIATDQNVPSAAGVRQRLSLPPTSPTASSISTNVVATDSDRGKSQNGPKNATIGEPLPDLRAATASAAEVTSTQDSQRLHAAYRKAEQNYHDAMVRGEAGGVKRALALIRDHADILRLNEKDAAPEEDLDTLLLGKTSGQGEKEKTPLLGAQLNPRVALGAKIAMLRGTGEEDEEGNPVLPVIDDKGLTVGQRLRHLRDEREMAAREKQRVHTEHSRKLKRNIRARKRLLLTERRARRAAQAMDCSELVEALRQRGNNPEGSGEELDELRRVFAQEYQHDMRVRLHATSRWTKSKEKHRPRTDTVEVGEIAAKRQRALASWANGPSIPPSRAARHHFRNRFWVKATEFGD